MLVVRPWVDSDEDAEKRWHEFRSVDPFPDIPKALLSKEHIKQYVQATAMLYPFYKDDENRLKVASYEAWPKTFIRWGSDGLRVVSHIKTAEEKERYKRDGYELPANSITFVQIESKIRLPYYIALRFNLRIAHVHRGLLLGTGPLIDPGFHGDLLIPLHNLTSEPYRIREGLIWIEFTKTSDIAVPPGEFEDRKKDLSYETYFERASGNNPIQSSIPKEICAAKDAAEKAERSARRARNANRFFAGISFLAILGLVLAAVSIAIDVEKTAGEAKETSAQSIKTQDEMAREINQLKSDLQQLSNQVHGLTPQKQP